MSGVLRIDHCCEVLDFVNTFWFWDVFRIKEFSVSGFWKFSKSKSLWSSIFENFPVKGQKWFFDFFVIAHTGYIYTLPLPVKSRVLKRENLLPTLIWPSMVFLPATPPHPTPPIVALYCGLQIANNLLYINSILWETSFWAIYYFLHLPSTISSHLLGVFSWWIWPIPSRVG